jgi:hypothetical protein
MTKHLLAFALLVLTVHTARAQGADKPTQALIATDSKNPVTLTSADVILKIGNRNAPLAGIIPVPANQTQVALLIDEGIGTGISHELGNLRDFVNSLPQGTEVFVGYMSGGHVVPAGNLVGFTADRAAAAKDIHMTSGISGASSGPYFCLSDFANSWPPPAQIASAPQQQQQQQPTHKARFILMITNGADSINGTSGSVHQDSPSVDTAIFNTQRAGIPVYSIYFSEAGVSASGDSFVGQSYLDQLAQGTGAVSFNHSSGRPASLAPFLDQFKAALAASYVINFPVDVNKKMIGLKFSTTLPKTKLRGPEEVRPGTIILAP